MKRLMFSMLLMPVLLLGVTAQGQTTRPTFTIGVWQQPTSSFAKWKDLGVNTLVCHADEGGRVSKSAWEAQAAAAGLWFVDYPGENVPAEARQAFRLGFLQLDEPDLSSHQGKPGFTLADLAAVYAKCKATGVPVWLTCAGSAFDNQWYDGRKFRTDIKADRPFWHSAADGGYMAHCDRVGWDYYLWSSGRGGMFEIWRTLMDRANAWSGGKPQYLFIETSALGKDVAFDAAALRAQVWHVVLYCATRGYPLQGIVYFTHEVYPWWRGFDLTSPEVAAAMKQLNAELAGWSAGKLVAAATQPSQPTPPTQPTQPATQPSDVADLSKIREDLAAIKATLNRIYR